MRAEPGKWVLEHGDFYKGNDAMVSTGFGVYGFRIHDKDKISIKVSNAYPECLGLSIVDYIRSHSNDQLGNVAERIIMVGKVSPMEGEIYECIQRSFANFSVGPKNRYDWYCLLYNIQGILDVYDCDFHWMYDGSDWIRDENCEWAYIIDTDQNHLEIYRSNFFKTERRKGGNERYKGVFLMASVPFSALRGNNVYEVRQNFLNLVS